ncbi:hypothetical protein QBC40DRAFT_286703 [Triangularia verruculosa]|uniref:Uncharacterized protein n=1 Tax=Triangularia verruculosa TaxID=2587418 RepID=A0AAN6X9T4_9PEZI|nr:hypothetical protein QBC40DRAFT_286703 [Triangularia verruculosa]
MLGKCGRFGATGGLPILAYLIETATSQVVTTPPSFQGFSILSNGAASPVHCPESSNFYTSSTYGACCKGTIGCDIATACQNGTYSFLFGGRNTCGSNAPRCAFRTVLASSPTASESWIVVLCTQTDAARTTQTLFRETTDGPPSTSTSISTTAGPLTTSTAPTTTVDPAATSSSTTSPVLEPQQSPSNAWIAGAVIGPIAAVAIIWYLGFWLGKRRANRQKNGITDTSQPDSSGEHELSAVAANQGPSHKPPEGYHGPYAHKPPETPRFEMGDTPTINTTHHSSHSQYGGSLAPYSDVYPPTNTSPSLLFHELSPERTAELPTEPRHR